MDKLFVLVAAEGGGALVVGGGHDYPAFACFEHLFMLNDEFVLLGLLEVVFLVVYWGI